MTLIMTQSLHVFEKFQTDEMSKYAKVILQQYKYLSISKDNTNYT